MTRFLFLLLACLPSLAFASMRCEESVVERGYTFIEVLERCGRPDAEFRRADFLVPGVYTAVEEWFYEQGRNRFRRLLTFENGRLARIELRPKPVHTIEQIFEP